MRVIGIIGSLRKDSIHRQIFNHYQALCKGLFELEEGIIEGIPLYDGESTANRVLARLAEQLRHADGVIFFSPEYNYSIPAALKNALDWLSRMGPQPLAGKASSIVGASPGNVGTARMQYHLRQVGVYLDMHFLNKPEVMIANAGEKLHDGRISDRGTEAFLVSHAEAFRLFAQKAMTAPVAQDTQERRLHAV